MLVVDQAAGSYRALMILTKKHPSWQRAPKGTYMSLGVGALLHSRPKSLGPWP